MHIQVADKITSTFLQTLLFAYVGTLFSLKCIGSPAFSCQQFYNSELSNRHNIETFYDSNALTYHETFKNRTDDSAFLEPFLKVSSGRTLDAGCGDGRFFPILTKYSSEVIGVDISSEMLAIAQNKHPRRKFIKMDLRALEFGDSSFDTIVAMYSLIHLTKIDAEVTLRQFNRVLSAKGKLFLALQEGPDSIKDLVSPITGRQIVISLFSKTRMISLLQTAGFRVELVNVREHITGVELPFPKLYIVAEKTN